MYIAEFELGGRITRRSVRDYLPILDYVKNKKKVRALILVINSEGGDANASEILFNKVKEVSSSKPVYAVIEGLGASGAYWIATAASRIYAMETSLVGSIGVISIFPNVAKLLEKIGVSVEINKIGEFKDMTSPFKEMDPASRERFRKILETTFRKFREDVRKNRKIPDEDSEEVFNGQIFSSEDALRHNLIDKISDTSNVAEELAQSLSMKKKVKEFAPKRPLIGRVVSSDFFVDFLTGLFR